MDLTARTTFLVTYDVSDPKRLSKTRKTMLGYGDPVQLSVFRCELTARELVEMRQALTTVIDNRADQVLIANLGPSDSRGSDSIESIGRAHDAPKHQAIVL